MGNPLKDIFSSNTPEIGLKFSFENVKDENAFKHLLKKVSETGDIAEVEGIPEVEQFVRFGNFKQEIPILGDLESIKIGPGKEKQDVTIETNFGNYTFNFYKYQIKNTFIMENDKNSIIHIKFTSDNSSDAISLVLDFNIKLAKTIEQLMVAFNAVISLYKRIESNDEINDQIRTLQRAENYWKILYSLEEVFDISFAPEQFPDDPEIAAQDEKFIYELYFLFVESHLIKQSVDNLELNMTAKLETDEPIENKELTFSFTNEIKREVYGQIIQYYTQNFIPNAIVSKLEEAEDGKHKLKLTGTDTKPMNIVYRAYKSEEEISVPDFNSINFDEVESLPNLIKKFLLR